MRPYDRLPQAAKESIRLFIERVSELRNHPIIRQNKFNAPDPTWVIIQISLLGNLPQECSEFERFDESQLYHLAGIIRLFDMKKEPTNIERITGFIRKGCVTREAELELREIEGLFRYRGREIIAGIDGVGQLQPSAEDAFSIYVNGHFLHSDRTKREEWKKYCATELEPYFYWRFVSSLIKKQNAIERLYNFLLINDYMPS